MGSLEGHGKDLNGSQGYRQVSKPDWIEYFAI